MVFKQYRDGLGGIVAIGQKAPDFKLKGAAGKEVHLSDFKGKLVFLNFWATWCAPCVEEMPDMELLYRSMTDKNFEMVAVSADVDYANVKAFYSQHQLTLPNYPDPGQSVARDYHTTGFPETFLIDGNGYIRKHYIGPQKWISPQVLSLIDKMVQEQGAAKTASN